MSEEQSPFKIFIVEDSPTAQETIREGLAKVPFPIDSSSCKTGQEAEAYLTQCSSGAEGGLARLHYS